MVVEALFSTSPLSLQQFEFMEDPTKLQVISLSVFLPFYFHYYFCGHFSKMTKKTVK